MTLRQLPGALILGLLASLVAHTLGFRDEHAQAGSYHEALIALAALGAMGLLGVVGFTAFSAAGAFEQGSVLASRVSSHLPSPVATLTAAAGWFIAAESLEPAHAAASLVVLSIALVVAVIALTMSAAVVIRAIAEIALAISSLAFAKKEFSHTRRAYVVLRAPSALALRRPVSRPPPWIQ